MLALLLLLAACTSDDTGDTAAGRPIILKPPAEGTTFRYQVRATGGRSLHWPGSIGEGQYKGTDYTEFVLGDFSALYPEGLRFWVDLGDGTTPDVGIRAIEVWNGEQETATLEYVFDPVAVFQMDGNLVGETLTLNPTGQFVVNGESQLMNLQIQYTLTTCEDTVDVPYNRVQGCWTWDLLVTQPGLEQTPRLSLKPKVGLVRIDWLPGNYTEVELEEVTPP